MVLSIILWIIQGLLALVFLSSGAMKLFTPFETMAAQMPLPLPEFFVRFLGVAEVLGALGLILPGIFRVGRALTPLAAVGLLIIMTGATVITMYTMGFVPALSNIVLGLLLLAVTYCRWSYLKGSGR